ncbi:Ger(x)C family spore germination protein [Vallitalea pronyensis]|uniref:Ger(X)C family spore germination protein n=1 Tax=Vallitalea pronyensis TaxID=1348613 RepID=A0A8J8MMM8_9FIRM|nr:Ger(x)C family spore germination protein [Vallitalea pronyensis]QUI24677.1 Ger(x)C family spore germination protein [Vallitalea pronyensis]
MRLKKMAVIVLIGVNMILLTSCFDYTEYEEMQLIFGLGVDSGTNGDVIVTIQSSGFKKTNMQAMGGDSGSSMGSQNSTMYKASGKTVLDALNQLQQITGKELFFGYIKVIIIGAEAAKKDMDNIMAFFYMSPRIRGSAYLLIAKNTAYDTLGTVNLNDSDLSAQSLENMVKKSVRSGVSFPIRLSNYYNIILTDGWNAAIPQVEYQQVSSGEQGGEKTVVNDTNPSIVPEKEGYHLVRNMVVFKDNKKVGVLDEIETMCYGFITGKKIKSSYVVKDKDTHDQDYVMGLRFLHNRSRINTHINNNQIKIDIDIDLQASIEEYQGDEALANIDVIKNFEADLSASLKNEIQTCIYHVQKNYEADIFGFGNRVFQQYPYKWQEELQDKWEDIFLIVDTDVRVTAKILNTGSNLEPFK